jgi:small subunit ribosomal protein S7
MSRKIVKKRVREGDHLYGNTNITLLINMVMVDGKRHKATDIVYSAIDQVLKNQSIEAKEHEVKKQKVNELVERLIELAGPAVEVVSKRLGGANYQVPRAVPQSRRTAYAFRWMIQFSRGQKRGRNMIERLAKEMTDILNGVGQTVQKKEEMKRMAKANEAYAHLGRA